MFDKAKFAQIIKEIKNTYTSQEEFSKKSGIGRTYLSQYMNMKIDKPPKPEILEKLAFHSNGIVGYLQLMAICGYINDNTNFSALQNRQLTKLNTQLNSLGISGSDISRILNILSDYLEPHEKHDEQVQNLINEFPMAKDYIIDYCVNEDSILTACFFEDNIKSNIITIPVVGKITAGQPILASEYIEDYFPLIPEIYGITNPSEYFYLTVRGDSMNRKVEDGDYVLIHKQDYAQDGDIVVAIVNGDNEATLKKFEQINEQFVRLLPMSTNPIHNVLTIDLKETEFKIIGKAIGNFGRF